MASLRFNEFFSLRDPRTVVYLLFMVMALVLLIAATFVQDKMARGNDGAGHFSETMAGESETPQVVSRPVSSDF
jgi:hypothetical protein